MSTTFIKAKKETNYTVLDNTFIKDCSLSWKAKGVMTYLLSLPEDWEIYLSELQNHATDGRDSLQNALKELIEKGYLVKIQKKDEKGRFTNNIFIIYEKPLTEKPLSEKSFTENPPLQNTNRQSTNIQSTDISIAVTEKSVSTPAPKKQKHIFGEYKKVKLTDDEFEKLKTDYGEQRTLQAIQYLDEYKAMKGKKYQSDYLALRKWVFKALDEKQPFMKNDVYTGNGDDW